MPLLFGHTTDKFTSQYIIAQHHLQTAVDHLLLARSVVERNRNNQFMHLAADPQSGAHPLV